MFRFYNVGNAIKTLARVLAVLEFIASIILAIYYGVQLQSVIVGVFVIAGGALVAYLGNMLLYATGQVVDDVHAMREDGIRTYGQPPVIYTRQEVAEAEKKSEQAADEKGIKY